MPSRDDFVIIWTICEGPLNKKPPYLHPISAHFELVDKAERNVTSQQEGLLLYNGGTVCDDGFSDNSATAICRAMGRPHRNVSWTSYPGSYLYDTVQSGKSINLDKVECSNGEWYQCSFLTTHSCKHEEDVFLSCGGKGAEFQCSCPC